MSNSCHGSNGVPRFLFKLLMIYFNVIIIDSPRIPPPSKDAYQPMKVDGKTSNSLSDSYLMIIFSVSLAAPNFAVSAEALQRGMVTVLSLVVPMDYVLEPRDGLKTGELVWNMMDWEVS